MKQPAHATHQSQPVKHRIAVTRVLVLVAVGMLAGCASLSPQQCLNADWRQIGYADGVKGLSSARIDDHARACAEQGVRPDLNAYLSGRAQGLVRYCQPENGFVVGRSGESHVAGDCPDYLRSSFLDQYNRGSEIHAIESEMNQLRSQANHYRYRQHQHDERIDRIRSELARKDLSTERRTKLLNEFNDLVEEKDELAHRARRYEERAAWLAGRLRQRLAELGRSY